MTRPLRLGAAIAAIGSAALLSACAVRGDSGEGSMPGPDSHAVIEHEDGANVISVARPEQFPVVAATERRVAREVTATGVVSPDVSRAVPVISLASGRVVDLRARLGDTVRRGQLLLRIRSADIASAAADYRKAKADETLALAQRDRTRELFDHGAAAQKDLEVAQDTAEKAAVDVQNSEERLRVLGVDPGTASASTGLVDIFAPQTGVITEQNVTPAAGVKTLDNSPNLFTIADLSHVWIVSDVYEADLGSVREGDAAVIRVAAFPNTELKGRVSNIGPILDPSLRTAKVRVEVANPGILRIGMFVTTTFRSQSTEPRAIVPATAVLHLHDRDWVYVPAPNRTFHRREVVGGSMLPGGLQELTSGLAPGEPVVSNALVLQNTVEQ